MSQLSIERGWGWGRTSSAALAAGLALAMLAPVSSAARGTVSVIVRAVHGRTAVTEHRVVELGGHIQRSFPVIDGFSASIPEEGAAYLKGTPDVASVTPNARLDLMSYQSSLGYDPDAEMGSLLTTARIVQATDSWAQRLTGSGVDVALLDSGVTPVEGLATAGKIINGPDLSFDSQTPNTRYLDTYGHGTHMAGIIAGKDSNAVAPYTDPSSFTGVAPDARIVSVKVAAANGATDVSQVLAGMNWIIEHRTDNGMNIRVLNLSFGTNSTQDYRTDPLTYAAEIAWRDGIVVVVSSGNGGQAATSLTDPATDPYVIAVGADDPAGTLSTNDDVVAAFSSWGNSNRHSDVIAPGRSILGLRVPGSYLDFNYPTARVGTRFFKGSGTSQATAVVSGVVALLLQQRPSLTPDQVKWILQKSATSIKGSSLPQGAGIVSSKGARLTPTPNTAVQSYDLATGTGSLEAARGGVHVSDAGGALTGEQDIFGHAWNGNTWSVATLAGNTWSGGTWNGNTWSGNTWSGNTWSGNTWSGNTWSGNTWSGNTWSNAYWDGNTWSGNTWSGNTWSGNTWSGNTWSGITWSGNTWSQSVWSSSSWA
ncbi:MAG: S8 family serine peptidase [Actinomycetota bacterium]